MHKEKGVGPEMSTLIPSRYTWVPNLGRLVVVMDLQDLATVFAVVSPVLMVIAMSVVPVGDKEGGSC
jgi:hypothetical protein